MLDTRTLRYFIAVAEDLHFGRAADRLHVAQSAVSFQIKKLEDQLGALLINRGQRSLVSLTPVGKIFLVEARRAVDQLGRAERIGLMAGRGEVGHVALGYVASAATTGLLPAVLRRLREHCPAVRLEIMLMETPRQLAAIEEGAIDVALVRPRPGYPPSVTTELIHRERLSVAFPENHPLAKLGEPVRAAGLRHETFIIPQFDEDAGFARSLTRLADQGSFTVAASYWLPDFISALCMAAAGYGVVLGPESMRQNGIGGLTYRAISDFPEEVELAFAYHAHQASPACHLVLEQARLAAADLNVGFARG